MRNKNRRQITPPDASMNYAFQFTYLLSLLSGIIISGAWWYAAVRVRNVSVFFWLAAAHTFSLAVHILQIVNSLGERNIARIASIGQLGLLVSLIIAGMYVALVRWLVERLSTPDKD
jgi:glucan phosphoethanolaminetransferase (alkaline phosphatase superfamily)